MILQAPWPLSSARVGFIHNEGTNFMHQYLMPLASLLGTVPHPLKQLGGIPYGQRSVQLVGRSLHGTFIYSQGGTACVLVGSALHAPVPQDTTSTGPHCPDPDEDISELHLHHGVQLVTSYPPFIDGGRFCSPSSSSPGSSSVPSFWRPHGESSFSSSPSPCHLGRSSFSFSPVGIMGVAAGHRLRHLFWGALLLWSFLCLSLVRSRMFHHWWRLP